MSHHTCAVSDDAKAVASIGNLNFGITDFDADDSLSLEPEVNIPSTSKHESEKGFFPMQTVSYDDKYDRIKARKRKVDLRDEFSDSYSSDEEYTPYPDELSDEQTEEDFDEAVPVSLKHSRKKGTVKLGKHHKKLVCDLKSETHKKSKKVIDDGDIKAYQQRIRELRLKERLRATGRLDEVQSDLNEDEDEDGGDDEIALKGGFALSVKLWRKLYK